MPCARDDGPRAPGRPTRRPPARSPGAGARGSMLGVAVHEAHDVGARPVHQAREAGRAEAAHSVGRPRPPSSAASGRPSRRCCRCRQRSVGSRRASGAAPRRAPRPRRARGGSHRSPRWLRSSTANQRPPDRPPPAPPQTGVGRQSVELVGADPRPGEPFADLAVALEPGIRRRTWARPGGSTSTTACPVAASSRPSRRSRPDRVTADADVAVEQENRAPTALRRAACRTPSAGAPVHRARRAESTATGEASTPSAGVPISASAATSRPGPHPRSSTGPAMARRTRLLRSRGAPPSRRWGAGGPLLTEPQDARS